PPDDASDAESPPALYVTSRWKSPRAADRTRTPKRCSPESGNRIPSHHLFAPPFENGFHLGRELIGQSAVDQAMIERQREIAGGTDRDGVIDNHRLLHHAADPKDRNLGLIDHRSREDAAEAAEICERERAALHFIGPQLTRACASREIHDIPLQAHDVLLVR